MRLLSTATAAAALRHYSAAAKRLRPPSLAHIHSKYKSQAISDAQKALTDYLHATRSLPYAYAEHIARNSPFHISSIVSKLSFSPSAFPKTLRKFLSYNPVNEFEFFFESIGVSPSEIRRFLPRNKNFFAEDSRAFDAACALSDFGFPWRMLGRLFQEEPPVFALQADELTARLREIKGLGFNTFAVIGICLAFPSVLRGNGEIGGEIDALFGDLKRVFLDFDLMGSVGESVDAWYEVCRKIRVFYDLGCEYGNVGELMGRNKRVLVEYPEDVLVRTAEFFRRLIAENRNVGLLLLEKPEILSFELENRTFGMLGFLKHFGLSTEKLQAVSRDYPHVFGRNRIANLPQALRALNLQVWFFDKIRDENHNLLAEYSMGSPEEDIDRDFLDSLDRIHSSRTYIHTINKLDFLHRIGFGENSLTIQVLKHMHGSSYELEERFNCLLHSDFEFSNLCKMTTLAPKILNQSPKTLERKVNYIRQDMGVPLQKIEMFPACLCFNLEDRIKPRYRMQMWIIEMGLDTKNYSLSSIIATSEKNFMIRLFNIHPALPKLWLESFSRKA